MSEKLRWLFAIWVLLASVESQTELIKANSDFAVDLYKKIVEASNGKNMFFCPFSISTALGMVKLGAKGNTSEQIKTVLHLDTIGSYKAVKEGFKKLLAAFNDQSNDYTLHLVNRLFGSNEFTFQEKFLRNALKYFDASLEKLDFVGKPEESRDHINKWVEKETNNTIKGLLPPESVTADTILLLVNAIHFKAAWVYPFEKALTAPGPFKISKFKETVVDMMHLNNKPLSYYNSTELNCEVLELPYEGDKVSMFVFLPRDADGLSNLEKQLNGEKLVETIGKVRNQNMAVQFPKFQFDQAISLKESLQGLGMVDAFDTTKADLSGIGGPGRMVVTDAIQKAFVNVTESGTEAAAATGVVIGVLSVPSPPIQFNASRPFFFCIYETSAKIPLFMGRVLLPPTSNESV